MSTKLLVPLEQAKKTGKQSLGSNSIDQDMLIHLMIAQSWAEKYCRRGFDGEKLQTEYQSGNRTPFINLTAYPIISISELNIDNVRAFTSSTIVDPTLYWTKSELGELGLVSTWEAVYVGGWAYEHDAGKFPKGEDNIRIKYYGGFIPEKTAVAAASKTATHVIANDLSALGVPMYLFVKTSGAFSGVGAGIAITGLDENGNSFTENIVPNVTDTSAATPLPTLSYSTSKFTKITAVDSSALTGAGTVAVTAVSTPNDLRHAISVMANYLLNLDQKGRIGVKSRSTGGSSETLDVQQIPPTAKYILDMYRNILF